MARLPVPTVRPLTRDDLPALGGWLAEEHVERWWHHDPSPDAVEADFGAAVDGREPTDLFVIVVDGADVGMVQRYRNAAYPEYLATLVPTGVADLERSAAIDYLIGRPDLVGRGIGPAAIDLVTRRTFEDWPDVTSMVVAVDRDNVASRRALEKAGYELRWSGDLEAEDPRDAGPSHVLVRVSPMHRTPAPGGGDGEPAPGA